MPLKKGFVFVLLVQLELMNGWFMGMSYKVHSGHVCPPMSLEVRAVLGALLQAQPAWMTWASVRTRRNETISWINVMLGRIGRWKLEHVRTCCETWISDLSNMFGPGLQCHIVAFRSNPAMQPVTCGDLAESTKQGGFHMRQSKIRVVTNKHMDRMEHKKPGIQSHQSYPSNVVQQGFVPLLKLMS